MDNNLQLNVFQAIVGLAALLDLLEEKGIITEAEYTTKYEETKKSSWIQSLKK